MRGCSPDTPTVCPSPHDDDDHLDDEDGEEPVLPVPIGDRVASVERVLSELRGMAVVTTAIDHSPVFVNVDRGILFNPELWRSTNERLSTALSTCAATVEKEVKRMTLKFIQECMCIDTDAAGLYNDETLQDIDTSDPAVCRHISLLLQIIAIEYKGVFVRQIESSMGGGTLSIKEKSDQAFSHAIDSDPSSLFP